MRVLETPLPGVFVVEPRVIRDERGFFLEAFNANEFAAAGLPTVFRQDNVSRSWKHVLRGLHYQLHRPQGKLVGVIRGAIHDVAVDVRRGSPSFGRWFGSKLTEDDARYLWIPPGFAHGFCVLSDVADVVYKCTDVYVRDDDRGIHWSDPGLAIEWGVTAPIVSARDRDLLPLGAMREDLPLFESSAGPPP